MLHLTNYGGFVLNRFLIRSIFLVGIGMHMFTMDAEAKVTNINTQELTALLEKGATLIDIRTEPEWLESGVIPGSHLLMLFDEQRRLVDPDGWLAKVQAVVSVDKPVILICRVGNRTVPATQFLAKSGYKQVYHVTGGIVSWIKAGLPVVRKEETTERN